MPDGLEQVLSHQDVANLIAYLLTPADILSTDAERAPNLIRDENPQARRRRLAVDQGPP